MNEASQPLPSLSGYRRKGTQTLNVCSDSETTRPADTESVLVAVCTYNEASNLPELTSRIFAALPQAHLLIVDDNSPDGSGRWAIDQAVENQRLRVIIRENERGLGGAIKCAMQYAIDQDYTYLLNLDGDLSHAPESLPEMLGVMQNDPSIDVVVGSRYCPGGAVHGWSTRRRWMSRLVNGFAVNVLRLPVSDCSGSFRCYRVSRLKQIQPASLASNGYSVLEEVLIKLAGKKARMVEVPIEFHDRTSGDSKLTLRETIRSATHLIKLAIRRG